jgi:hypothetical protein
MMIMDDPRVFPESADASRDFAQLYATASASLGAVSGRESAVADAEIDAAIAVLLRSGEGANLARLFAGAPSAAIYRHLWRRLARREEAPAADLALRIFVLPVVIVAGLASPTSTRVTLPAILDESAAITRLLREHDALAGHATFALGNTLVGADALDFAQLPSLATWETLGDPQSGHELPPAPIGVEPGPEGVHLRFLVGSVLVAPGATPFNDAEVGRWGTPLAQWLGRALAVADVSVLALPRAPARPSVGLVQGRAAQREVAAQLFAGHAIRQLRASVGEPTAVISVHQLDSSPTGAEVRLSLSSPFAPREAQGFRCPLLPLDRVDDVVRMLTDLMHDCRVNDVRLKPGVHADRDRATGLPLLFKDADPSAVH